jgi:hypothetical protein
MCKGLKIVILECNWNQNSTKIEIGKQDANQAAAALFLSSCLPVRLFQTSCSRFACSCSLQPSGARAATAGGWGAAALASGGPATDRATEAAQAGAEEGGGGAQNGESEPARGGAQSGDRREVESDAPGGGAGDGATPEDETQARRREGRANALLCSQLGRLLVGLMGQIMEKFAPWLFGSRPGSWS